MNSRKAGIELFGQRQLTAVRPDNLGDIASVAGSRYLEVEDHHWGACSCSCEKTVNFVLLLL